MIRAILTRTIVCNKSALPTCTLTYKRNFSSNEPTKDDVQKAKPISNKVAKIKKYWFFRYLDYIANFDKTLEKTFPRMIHIYRQISSGTKDLYVDIKKFVIIKKKETLHGSDNLSREELHLNHTLPRDLAKITPVLLILAIPFTNYILFPMAYFFPRRILTSHYWSPEQKEEFLAYEHKLKQQYVARVLMSLEQEQKHTVASEVKEHWDELVKTLRSKIDPTPEQILACEPLFRDGPFTIRNIKRPHVRELLLIYNICVCQLYKREALIERGNLIKLMDIAIVKEGGPSKMTPLALNTTLSFRGIDPTRMTTEQMEFWLDKWLEVSAKIDEQSISLLLHCPVLLAYNLNTS